MTTKKILQLSVIAGLLLINLFYGLNAQVLYQPNKYIVPQDKLTQTQLDKVLDDNKERMPGRDWIVYSDRDNNNTFMTSDGNIVKKTIQFLDQFYVVEETQTRLKIVKDKNNIADDWGWIDKKNLLLWDHCLVKPMGRIDLKAMTLNTVDFLKSGDEKDFTRVNFYKDPEMKIKAGKTSNIYEIFFVMKKQGNAALLTTQSIIKNREYIKNYVVGWVDMNRVTMWDNRIALEPNWETEQVRKLSANGKRLLFFKNRNETNEYLNTGDPEKNIGKSSFKKERMGGYDKRFPSLDNDNKTFANQQVFKVGFMGDLKTQKGEIEKEEHAKMDKKYNELRSNLHKINLFFVVDATKSMQKYYSPICRAIRNTIENKKGETYNYRFGAAIYRDQDERTENGGLGIADHRPLDGNTNQIIKFLSDVVADDKKDHDKPEAVFYGLKKAIEGSNLSDRETNLVILIGDAGNHCPPGAPQVSENDIADLLFKKKCHFLSFQVARGTDHSTYEDFNSQMEAIMMKTARKFINDPDFQNNYKSTYSKPLEQPQIKRLDNNIEFITDNPFLARKIHPEKGKTISPDELSIQVEKIIKDIRDFTEKLLDNMKGTFEEGEGIAKVKNLQEKEVENQGFSYSSAMMFYMKEMGINDDQLSKISSKSFQLYTESFTPSYYIIQNEKVPAFKPVLLYTQKELGALIIEIQKLIDENVSPDKVREDIVRVWIEILKEHTGNIDEEKAKKDNLKTIYEYVFGLPGTSELLEVQLEDFYDPLKIDDNKLNKYFELIKTKSAELDKIYNNAQSQLNRSFRCSDTPYFWIEQDLIP